MDFQIDQKISSTALRIFWAKLSFLCKPMFLSEKEKDGIGLITLQFEQMLLEYIFLSTKNISTGYYYKKLHPQKKLLLFFYGNFFSEKLWFFS